MLRQVQLQWSGPLVRMDDRRLPKRLFYGDVATGARRQGGGDYPNDFSTEMSLRVLAGREVKDYPNDFSTVMSLRVLAGREVKKVPKRLFYGDVATGARRQGGQKRHYKHTLKKYLKQLQIDPATWEDHAQDRLTWRRSVKTGSTIRPTGSPPPSPIKRHEISSAPDQHCQCGPLRTQCTNNPTIPTSTSNSVNPPSDFHNLTPVTNSITPTIIEITSQYSLPIPPTTATTTAFATAAFTTTTKSDGDSLLNCPQCDHTFTSRIGLVGHLPMHRTETGENVLGEPTHSRDRHLHCFHCHRARTHRMGLFGHTWVHDSGIHRNADNTDTPCTPSAPVILTTTATPTTMNDIPPASPDFSCSHCARNLNSRIGLVGHKRIRLMEPGEPVPGALTYS
ncbi:unnamed protein product [Schistocephalus solidus]|uniref:C2H2-type domain-containing protein n=1 Tax=Schistocephalus solidus TaxID=70667 RepID=A0A183SP38_SCHSO|nr:unnamed protein product [Schistocephalus solidus]